MLHFIGAVIAGFIGIFAALIGIGLGIGALLIAAAPFLLLLLIPLLPVLLLVWILRAIGILRGPVLTFIVLIAGVFVLMGGFHSLWNSGSNSVEDWIESKKQALETCRKQGGDDVEIQWQDDDIVFICRGKERPGAKPLDTHL